MKTCPSCGKEVAALVTDVHTRRQFCWFCTDDDPGRRALYIVRVLFSNRHDQPFSWPFEVEAASDRHAIREAVTTFWSGLTDAEREDAVKTMQVEARPVEERA
jgi:hypothetical protein